MGYYNYPIAHSYITRSYVTGADVGKFFGDLAGGAAKQTAAQASDSAKQQFLNDPAVDAKVKTLTQEAVDTGIDRAKQNIFGSIQGAFGAMGPYLPFIGIGIVAIVALMYFL